MALGLDLLAPAEELGLLLAGGEERALLDQVGVARALGVKVLRDQRRQRGGQGQRAVGALLQVAAAKDREVLLISSGVGLK